MQKIEVKATDKAFDEYYKTLDDLRHKQDATSEGSLRRAFGALLSSIARARKWTLVEEDPMKVNGRTIYYDGVLRDEWKLPHGRWEAKDPKDTLDKAVRDKRDKGYQFDNIIFEDTRSAWLYQDGEQTASADVRDRDALAALLTAFLNYEVQPFTEFSAAVTYFQQEIPTIAGGLKDKIDQAHRDNARFKAAFEDFMTLCQQSLNPNISQSAVDEMLIQHMLTERLIRKLFVDDFAQRNIIAGQVEGVIAALTSATFQRSEFLGRLDRFYTAIEDAADQLATFSDKQSFINTIYERFFQGYSVKTADTHGIVYTPQPIVDFMCASVQEVVKDEFGLDLGQEGVTILDPCTGTGNFIVNLLGRVNERYLHDFYKNQLFANEVMLMPYYIAALNIERTYYERTNRYEPFEGLCFVDTLDLHAGAGQMTLFSAGNTQRVERQQAAPITVIIGNPPYNVGQMNENDNNKNRKYDLVDARIKSTYAQASAATNKNMLYDAYVRFFRWAADRLGERDGVVCYVSNNGFVDSIAFDGFRKHMMQDFTRIYVVNLQGNVRKDSMRDGIPLGEEHTVFGLAAMVGISITILIKKREHADHKLLYYTVDWRAKRVEKFDTLEQAGSIRGLKFKKLTPDARHTWLIPKHAAEWDTFTATGTKTDKASDSRSPSTIFKTYSNGVKTNRDDVVYDFDADALMARVRQFIEAYNYEVDRYKRAGKPSDVDNFVNYEVVKWDSTLKGHLKHTRYAEYRPDAVRKSLYRPFTMRNLYFERLLINSIHLQHYFFPTPDTERENRVIVTSDIGRRAPQFTALITNTIPDLHLCASVDAHQCFPFYTYDESGQHRRENITDWALEQFRTKYGDSVTKWDIFHYVYALLHHPLYREKFADNLKRDLPRIPFVAGAETFRAWAGVGARLASLHLDYESGPRYQLDWQTSGPVDYRVTKMKRQGEGGGARIIYNETLALAGIPAAAWDYRLGNRSALDWIIDQYQVKTDKRSGIVSDPNAYSDDPQYIVKLVERVTHVSVETMRLVGEMGAGW